MIRRSCSTFFPYTTLFRSVQVACQHHHSPGLGRLLGDEDPQRVGVVRGIALPCPDRKSTRLNSSHVEISYAVFCLKKKKKKLEIEVELKRFAVYKEYVTYV